MWSLSNMVKARPFANKDIPPEPQQPTVRKKRHSEEDAKSSLKRAALVNITNKPEQACGRLTRAQSKKKELLESQQSLLCLESTTNILRIQKPTSPARTPSDRMSVDIIIAGQLKTPPSQEDSQPDEAARWNQIPHEDIDVDDNDPQLCKIYVNDIYEYLRESEVKYRPIDYMLQQREINSSMRAILVDWLVEVAEEYKLSSETLYLGVCYLDRYLSKRSVARSKLQLVGVACLLLASKYEEIYPPSVKDFVYISDNTYRKEEVFAMETDVLSALEFSLTVATIKNFLRRFLKAAFAKDTTHMLANFLCELSLHEYTFMKFLPSVVAAAAVYLALRTVKTPESWSTTLEYYTHLTPAHPDVRACIIELHALHKVGPRSYTQAVHDKYSIPNYYKVSNHKVVPPCTSLF